MRNLRYCLGIRLEGLKKTTKDHRIVGATGQKFETTTTSNSTPELVSVLKTSGSNSHRKQIWVDNILGLHTLDLLGASPTLVTFVLSEQSP
jgi:hypothetical protein